MKALVWFPPVLLIFTVRIAHAQGSGAQGDALLAAGSFAEAGEAYRKAFDETRDPTFLKKAAQAHLQLGSVGKGPALEAAKMYALHARNIEEAKEAQALRVQVEALPEPPPPAPPPPPVIVAPPSPPPDSAAGPPAVSSPALDPAAARVWDVLYLRDGTVVRGLISSARGGQYTVTLLGGAVVVVPAIDVREVGSEPNPDYHATEGVEDMGALAQSGFRFAVAPGLALPVGAFRSLRDPNGNRFYKTSFDIAGRIGGEIVSGPIGFSPAVRVEYVRWGNAADASHGFLHIGGDLRLAGHAGRVVPYLFVSPGADINFFDVFDGPGLDLEPGRGFGFEFGAGMDVLVAKHAALGASFTYHPGFTSLLTVNGVHSDEKISYVAFNAGFSIY